MKRALLILFLTAAAGAQVTLSSPSGTITPGTIGVTLTPAAIPINGTSTLSAILFDSNGSPNALQTPQCFWTSSNISVATVPSPTSVVNGAPLNIATGILAGTTTIKCSLAGGQSGSATLTVLAGVVITNPPVSCTAPCVLPGATNGTAYTFQFAESGGTGTCIWSVSSGSFNTGLALSSTGLVSGTPTVNGTQTPTVQVACTNGTTTLQVSLTVSAASGCGPPNYTCTPNDVTAATAPYAIPFSGLSSACIGGTTAGCGGADNTLVSDPEPVALGNNTGLYHHGLTRITNYYTGCGAANESACPVSTVNATIFNAGIGGSNDVNSWAVDDSSFMIQDAGTCDYFYGWNTSTKQATLWYTSRNNTGPCTAFAMPKAPTYSTITNNIVYGPANAALTSDGTAIVKYTLNSPPTLPTNTIVVDLANISAHGSSYSCLPSTIVASTDPLMLSYNDATFSDAYSTSALENTGRYVAQWAPGNLSHGGTLIGTCYLFVTSVSGSGSFITMTCGTITGCTTSSASVTCQNCGTGITNPGTFTIHNMKATLDGQYAIIQPQACDSGSTCYFANNPILFQFSTGNVWMLCNGTGGSLNRCGGHWTEGYSSWLNAANVNNTAGIIDTTALTAGILSPVGMVAWGTWNNCWSYGVTGLQWDSHLGWQNDYNSGTTTDATWLFHTYASDVDLPNYSYCLVNEIVGVLPSAAPNSHIKRFSRTYSAPTGCFGGEIASGAISQTGKFEVFTSTMWNAATSSGLGCGLGNTTGCVASTSATCGSATSPRTDVFVLDLTGG